MENSDKKCETCGSSECKGCGQGQCGSCHGGMCSSMMKHGCCGGRHSLFRVILKIVIVVIIFWCGFKIGEMTGFIRAEYGGGYNMMDGNGFGFRMMRGGYYNSIPVINPSANPSGTTPVPAQ